MSIRLLLYRHRMKRTNHLCWCGTRDFFLLVLFFFVTVVLLAPCNFNIFHIKLAIYLFDQHLFNTAVVCLIDSSRYSVVISILCISVPDRSTVCYCSGRCTHRQIGILIRKEMLQIEDHLRDLQQETMQAQHDQSDEGNPFALPLDSAMMPSPPSNLEDTAENPGSVASPRQRISECRSPSLVSPTVHHITVPGSSKHPLLPPLATKRRSTRPTPLIDLDSVALQELQAKERTMAGIAERNVPFVNELKSQAMQTSMQTKSHQSIPIESMSQPSEKESEAPTDPSHRGSMSSAQPNAPILKELQSHAMPEKSLATQTSPSVVSAKEIQEASLRSSVEHPKPSLPSSERNVPFLKELQSQAMQESMATTNMRHEGGVSEAARVPAPHSLPVARTIPSVPRLPAVNELQSEAMQKSMATQSRNPVVSSDFYEPSVRSFLTHNPSMASSQRTAPLLKELQSQALQKSMATQSRNPVVSSDVYEPSARSPLARKASVAMSERNVPLLKELQAQAMHDSILSARSSQHPASKELRESARQSFLDSARKTPLLDDVHSVYLDTARTSARGSVAASRAASPREDDLSSSAASSPRSARAGAKKQRGGKGLPPVKRVIETTQWVTPEEATVDIVRLCLRHFYDPISINTCVLEGAYVTYMSPDMDRPILHHMIANGHVKCLAACLKTERPIDFTIPDTVNRCTPLHLACQISDTELSTTMLQLIVDRLATHPDDKVDWGQLNHRGRDFMSWVAAFQDLASVWAIVKDIPFFAKRPIPISTRPFKSNWDRLGKEQVHFTLLNGLQPDPPTIKLVRLCMNPPPKPEDVQGYVDKGGDVMYEGPEMERPVLHQLILEGRVDCVAACLTTARSIDFAVKDATGLTPLHCACLCRDPQKAVEIVELVIQRLKQRETDHVDWLSLSGNGMDFLSLAAENMKLARLFPIVRHAPHFPSATPYQLRSPLDRYDYDVIGEDIQLFDLREGLMDDTLALANLCRQPNPNPAAVQVYVDEGADLSYESPDMDRPILHHFIRAGHVDCVTACMNSPLRINFTVQDRNKYTPAHTVFRCPTVEQGEDMLKLLVQRLSTHPLDKVDWSIKDKLEHDFFAWAVKCKKSSPVYRFMKYSPYFRQVRKDKRRNQHATLMGHMDDRI
eukprot:gene446-229_t